MDDFSSWLKKSTSSDSKTKALQQFALDSDDWPVEGDGIKAYQAVIADANPTNRDELLTALGQLFERWSLEKKNSRRGWFDGARIALVLAGFLIAAALIYGLWWHPTFLTDMAGQEYARGLITFLFAFATIAIIVVVGLSLLWMDKQDIEARYEKAKDLITILVGVLGTIIGFYFGSTSKDNSEVRDRAPIAEAASCRERGGVWDANTNTCSEKQ